MVDRGATNIMQGKAGQKIVAVMFFSILFFAALFICRAHGETPLKKISFIPLWSPQAQFAGYYVAYEEGIYKKHGIDLQIIQGGPFKPSTELLEKEEADVATIWLSTAIQKRSHGVKLVNIAQMIQRSSLMLIAKKARGFVKPQDLEGKKVGLWGDDFRIQPTAFFKKYNLNVKIVPQSYSVNLFLRDGVDAASAMWYNEYHTILNAGINSSELTTFFYADHGLNFPEDGIYMLEKTLKSDPELACAFVRASIEGWIYAFDHPERALDIVHKYMTAASVPANRVHQRWMLERIKDVMMPKGKNGTALGVLKKEDYERVGEELKKSGLIDAVPDISEFVFGCTGYAKK